MHYNVPMEVVSVADTTSINFLVAERTGAHSDAIFRVQSYFFRLTEVRNGHADGGRYLNKFSRPIRVTASRSRSSFDSRPIRT